MKYTLVVAVTGFLLITSCKKETSFKNSSSSEPPHQTNTAPVAKAGPDQTIYLPVDSVQLDGSGSYDPDGVLTEWRWTMVSGPSSVDISDAYKVKTGVKRLTAGIYQFELRVKDSGSLYGRDTLLVTVLTSTTNTYPPTQEAICVTGRREINARLVPIGRLASPKYGITAASTANKIVFAAGWKNGRESSSVDIYDLTTQAWSANYLKSARVRPATAVMGNKIFLAGGGYLYDTYFSTVDIYDASTNVWSWTSLPVPKTGIAAAAVGNKILFAGGFKYDSDHAPDYIENFVEIYQPATSAWSTAELSVGRGDMVAVTADQKVYFAGGTGYRQLGLYSSNAIDIYDDATHTWSVSSLTYLETATAAIAMGNQIFWVKNNSCDVEIRNATTVTSRLEQLSRSGPGTIHAVAIGNKVLFIRDRSKYFDIYDTTTAEWSVGVLTEAVIPGASIISANNSVYIAGGVISCTPSGNGGCSPVGTDQVWKLEF